MKTQVLSTLTITCTTMFLGGCSTIIEGTTQEVMINTNPPAASCTLSRQGQVISRVPQTPAAATIKKTKYDITITCDKPGYQTSTYLNHSATAGATWGNIVAGGAIGWAVDSASGSDNKYESPVNITLVPGFNPPPVAPNK
ncbi:hypothetical protein GCM10008941_17080 [Rhizomicrobium palustre]